VSFNPCCAPTGRSGEFACDWHKACNSTLRDFTVRSLGWQATAKNFLIDASTIADITVDGASGYFSCDDHTLS
jgi:hypothetical protein